MFGQQRISSLQPTSRPSAPPPDDLAIIRTFPYEKAAIGPTPIRVLSGQTHPSSKTTMSRLDYETIAHSQSAKKESLPKGSWSHRSKFCSGESSRMKFVQRAASTASSSSGWSLRKLGIATWPSKPSRKATTKITICAVLSESPPKLPGSPNRTRTLSSIVDAPDPHDISAQYFGSPSADLSANEESEPGATAIWSTTSEDSSHIEASVLPENSDLHDSKRVEQQRRLAYYRLTGGEYQENDGVMDGLHADDFTQGAQGVLTDDEPQHGALVLRREGRLSVISEHRSKYGSIVEHAYHANANTKSQPAAENYISSEDGSFTRYLRTCAENAGSPPPIPKKSLSRRLRDFGTSENDRVDGPARANLPSAQRQRVSPSEVASVEEHDQRPPPPSLEPKLIAPTPLSPALPHFHSIEEAVAYRRSQDSKHTSPSCHASAKCDDDAYGNKASQTEPAKHIRSNSQLALKLPDISRDSIGNALTSARTSSTSLSPSEKARLRPEPLNPRSLARSSPPRRSSYTPPPPSPSLPLSPCQSKDDDSAGGGAVTAPSTNKPSEHETRSSEDDSMQLHFENPGSSTNTETNTDTDSSLTKIQSNSFSSKSNNKESIREETGSPHRTPPQGQSSAEMKSQSQSQSQSLDPDVKERQDWYGREVRLRVERIRRALRTKSFYSGGNA